MSSLQALGAVSPDRERVVAALLAVASHLEALTDERARRARAVRTSWAGPHRDRFDAERATRDAAAEAIISRCRHLARR